jgi:hypothetical protein
MRNLLVISLIASIAISCRKQPEIPPAVVNEPENITVIKLVFTDSAGIETPSTFIWKDIDGNGGQNPVIDSVLLTKNKTYFTQIIILDETKNPTGDVSAEILNEGSDHQFFFIKSNINTNIMYNDQDKNGNPIGLKSIWRTGNISSGKVEIILKHQPGVKVNSPGDINAGSSDIDISFNTRIKS